MARNKFPGYCYQCGLYVEQGTGHFERVEGKGWRVKHANVPGDGRITCEEAKQKEELDVTSKIPD